MKKYILILSTVSMLFSCTKLEEDLQSTLTEAEAAKVLSASQLLQATYNSMQGVYETQDRLWALQEHTTDECMGPTRAGDWDDNGIWRVLHNHKWNADHAYISATFNELLGIVFNATNVLNFNPTAQQKAEARYVRAYVMYTLLEGWNQVPFREPGEDLRQPSKVLVGTEALNFIISETTAALADLPDSGPAYQATKNAARALLMRAHLNAGVFANRATPTFAAGDMNKVIEYANAIIASNQYELTSTVFENFRPNNNTTGKGNIFTIQNFGGSQSGNIRARWFCTLHYNQTPSGWNGFTTLGDFYDKFESADERRMYVDEDMRAETGLNLGFLYGQQYDKTGAALKDRKGNNLAFTKNAKLQENGSDLEITGIRVMKYYPDMVNGDNSNNDAVLIRFEDVLLMKAEAIARGGTASGSAPYNTVLGILNSIRVRSNASPVLTASLDDLYDERGREFYWEGIRRMDMIRYGKYLAAYAEKPASTAERLMFPIPNNQLAVNPNLSQNPGY